MNELKEIWIKEVLEEEKNLKETLQQALSHKKVDRGTHSDKVFASLNYCFRIFAEKCLCSLEPVIKVMDTVDYKTLNGLWNNYQDARSLIEFEFKRDYKKRLKGYEGPWESFAMLSARGKISVWDRV